jgi:hypothetical protein
MSVVRNCVTVTAIATAALLIVKPAAAQTRWNEIAAPTGKEAVSRTYPAPYRTDVIDVPITAKGEIEYMIAMQANGTVIYSWELRAIADPQLFYTEFHGHTEPVDGRGDLMFYEKAAGAKAAGSLIAPWQGIHGWFWENKSDAAVTVRLRMAGFYELIPGQTGQAVKD